MMTSINGIIKGYWYKYGYVRTTSSQYSLNSNIGGIHLTNDAVQKNLADYGKYQKGNKISYEDLSAYIEKYHNKKGKGFYEYVYPKMKVFLLLFRKLQPMQCELVQVELIRRNCKITSRCLEWIL